MDCRFAQLHCFFGRLASPCTRWDMMADNRRYARKWGKMPNRVHFIIIFLFLAVMMKAGNEECPHFDWGQFLVLVDNMIFAVHRELSFLHNYESWWPKFSASVTRCCAVFYKIVTIYVQHIREVKLSQAFNRAQPKYELFTVVKCCSLHRVKECRRLR